MDSQVSGFESLVTLIQELTGFLGNILSYTPEVPAKNMLEYLSVSARILSLNIGDSLKRLLETVLSLPVTGLKLYDHYVLITVDASAREALDAWEKSAGELKKLGLRVYVDWAKSTDVALEELCERLARILGAMSLIPKVEEISGVTKHLGVEKVTPITPYYSMTQSMKREYVLALLANYLSGGLGSVEALKYIAMSGFVDLNQLASLILWLADALGYKVLDVSLVEDVETGEQLFVAVYVDSCDWEEWKILSKLVKEKLIESGLEELARRVAVVCAKALQTLRG